MGEGNTNFCSVHLYRLLLRSWPPGTHPLTSALCTCTDCFHYLLCVVCVCILLLCALVQLASLRRELFYYFGSFCSVHLYRLLRAFFRLPQSLLASALRTCTDCFRFLHRMAQGMCTSALRTCTDCFRGAAGLCGGVPLLLCALVQIASAVLHKSLSRNE